MKQHRPDNRMERGEYGFTGSSEIDNLIFYPDNTLNLGLAQ